MLKKTSAKLLLVISLIFGLGACTEEFWAELAAGAIVCVSGEILVDGFCYAEDYYYSYEYYEEEIIYVDNHPQGFDNHLVLEIAANRQQFLYYNNTCVQLSANSFVLDHWDPIDCHIERPNAHSLDIFCEDSRNLCASVWEGVEMINSGGASYEVFELITSFGCEYRPTEGPFYPAISSSDPQSNCFDHCH